VKRVPPPPGRRLRLLVTGTDTGVGKTYVGCLLARRLAVEGITVFPLKPVETGCRPGPGGSPFPADAAALRDAAASSLPLDAVCLYPFSAPLSPHLAARREGVAIDIGRIRGAVEEAARKTDVVLVEGAGGISVEIVEGYSFADLARESSLAVLVVAGNRLGVLNHVRLTIRYIESEGLPLFGIILSDLTADPFPARETNEDEVRRIAGERYLGRILQGAAVLPGELFSRILDFGLTR
jgi:dethiobiotin synthetase